MPAESTPEIAIVDCGLGNLYSVKQACAHVGLRARITSSAAEILAADAAILPGVGAFGDAMATLRRLDLVAVIRDYIAAGRPFLGVCLGMQLLMSESEEFGAHEGLGILEGTVARFADPKLGGRRLKVPQVGWNGVYKSRPAPAEADPWSNTLLQGLEEGEPMYFVHSYVVRPADPGIQLSRTSYGDVEFCSAVRRGNVSACQFHPERSGPEGLRIYRNLADRILGGWKE